MASIIYLSAECKRLWNIAMDIFPGVFPGRLLNICNDCWDKTEGCTGAVVVGVTEPPTMNLAPLAFISFSSLAELSSISERSKLSYWRPRWAMERSFRLENSPGASVSLSLTIAG